MNTKTIVSTLFWVILLSPASADDWPQWQGPDRNAISKERGLLKEWPKDGPPLAWKIKELGGGYSAPSIAAGRIFGMSNQRRRRSRLGPVRDGRQDTVDRRAWGRLSSSKHRREKRGRRCTPTVDGERLYVVGLGGDLACLQVRDGKIIWQRSLTRDFGGRPPMWSYRESPLVDGDKVICTPGGQDAILAALDKLTGKTIWKSQVPGGSGGGPSGPSGPGGGPGGLGGPGGPGGGPGSPGGGPRGFAAVPAVPAVLERPTPRPSPSTSTGSASTCNSPAKALVGVAASDGKFLWRYDRPANGMGINCSTPIYHDGLVFAASAYGAGGGLVKLSKDAERWRQGRRSLFHHEDAKPPRRHDPPRRLPVWRQRRQ